MIASPPNPTRTANAGTGRRSSAAACAIVLAVCTIRPGFAQNREAPVRRGPNSLYVEPRTGMLLVGCEKSGTVARVDPASGRVLLERQVGRGPFDLAAHPSGHRIYLSCRRGQEIVELDAETLQTLRRFALPGDPTGLAVSGDGKRLYVALHSLDRLAVLDLLSGSEIARKVVGNGPEMVRRSAADGRIYVTSLLPVRPALDRPPHIEVTVIDDRSGRIVDRIALPNANIGRHLAITQDGSTIVVAISRPKNLVPMVQVARGWVVTNGFALLSPGSDRPPVQLLIDLPNRSYADPYAVAMTPDQRKFYLTCAGSDFVLAVDLDRARQVADECLAGDIPRYADHLGLSRRYVTARIPVGANPHAIALSRDGKFAFVANRLDDSISVIDTADDRVVRTLVLGEPAPLDRPARGERLFHSAARTFHNQFACASCHPDNGFDGLQYDLEPDHLGRNILDNRNMRGVFGTEPFKWVGTNPDIATQCGTRTAKWITRTAWLTSVQVVDLVAYIHSLENVENPHRNGDGKLTRSQQRGKALFERTRTNDRKPIPQRDRCDFCHSGPLFTNARRSDVGTRSPHDSTAEFDSPHLTGIFESAPYLHDGRAATLEELWTKFNPDDKHGISSDWTKRQLNDLVEYLKSL